MPELVERRVSGSGGGSNDLQSSIDNTARTFSNSKKSQSSPQNAQIVAIALGCVTLYSFVQFEPNETCLWNVWNYGLVTCISTGLGAIPFLFIDEINDWWLGICNGNDNASNVVSYLPGVKFSCTTLLIFQLLRRE